MHIHSDDCVYCVHMCRLWFTRVLQLQAIAGTQVFKLETGEIITCTWHFLSLNLLVCLKIVCPYTQWLMVIIPTKWLFHWGYTPFSDIPICWFFSSIAGLGPFATPSIEAARSGGAQRCSPWHREFFEWPQYLFDSKDSSFLCGFASSGHVRMWVCLKMWLVPHG